SPQRVFWAAWFGWMLDGFDTAIYGYILVAALTELLPASGIVASRANIGFYGGLLFSVFMLGWACSMFWGWAAERAGDRAGDVRDLPLRRGLRHRRRVGRRHAAAARVRPRAHPRPPRRLAAYGDADRAVPRGLRHAALHQHDRMARHVLPRHHAGAADALSAGPHPRAGAACATRPGAWVPRAVQGRASQHHVVSGTDDGVHHLRPVVVEFLGTDGGHHQACRRRCHAAARADDGRDLRPDHECGDTDGLPGDALDHRPSRLPPRDGGAVLRGLGGVDRALVLCRHPAAGRSHPVHGAAAGPRVLHQRRVRALHDLAAGDVRVLAARRGVRLLVQLRPPARRGRSHLGRQLRGTDRQLPDRDFGAVTDLRDRIAVHHDGTRDGEPATGSVTDDRLGATAKNARVHGIYFGRVNSRSR